VTIGQGIADTPAGRKLNFSDFLFEVPDTHARPATSRAKMRVDGSVSAAAEVLASDRLSDLSATMVDPNSSKGTFSATVNLGMPVKGEMTKADTTYAFTADVTGFAADKLVMSQKLEANTLKVVANNQSMQVKGDVKINGQAATLDYRKPADGDADIKLQATLDDASRARLGLDLGSAVSGTVPVKLVGKIGSGDRDSRMGVEADLTALKLDNILPGWVKVPGKSSRAVFNVVPKAQSTRFEDIVIEGGPKVYDPIGKRYLQLRMVIPKGTPQDEVGNLLYKQLIIDMILGKSDFAALNAKLKDEAAAREVTGMLDEFLTNINTPIDVVQKHGALIRKYYMTNTDFVDNGGHAFGADLNDRDKKALTAYLATF